MGRRCMVGRYEKLGYEEDIVQNLVEKLGGRRDGWSVDLYYAYVVFRIYACSTATL